MPHVSKRLISTKEKDIFESFLKELLTNSKIDQTKASLDILLTKTEKTMLSKRITVFYLLDKGYTYKQISKIAKVTEQTIQRFGEFFSKMSNNNKKAIIGKIDKWVIKNNLQKIIKDILNTPLPTKLIHRKKSG